MRLNYRVGRHLSGLQSFLVLAICRNAHPAPLFWIAFDW